MEETSVGPDVFKELFLVCYNNCFALPAALTSFAILTLKSCRKLELFLFWGAVGSQ